MKKRIFLIYLIIIVGILSFMSFVFAEDTGTVTSPINCSSDAECPAIACVKAPCQQYVCREGKCISETITTPVCIDDDGKNYYEKGTAKGLDYSTGKEITKTDFCGDGEKANIVGEYYCEQEYVQVGNFNCPYGCKEGACVIAEETAEQVKCIFDNSNQEQKCYTAEQNSRAYCSGVKECATNILGYKGEKITWKSTCGGYAYTIIDGAEEKAKFNCKAITHCEPTKCDDGSVYECKIDNGQCSCPTCPGIIIKPKCGNKICEGGEGEICACPIIETKCEEGKECTVPACICSVVCPEDCKPAEPKDVYLNEKFKLQVYQSVDVLDEGNYLMKITFKNLIAYKCKEEIVSSEASETIASKVAIATGQVVASTGASASGGGTSGGGSTETTTTEILKCVGAGPKALLDVDMIVNNISKGHHILNLDLGEKKQVKEFTVSFLNYDYASRTGVFLVSRETFICPEKCTCDENGKTIECPVETCEKGKTLCPDGVCRDKCSIIDEECKYGCSYEGKCYPIGIRSSGMYCSTDLIMSTQLSADEKCENNFECSTNLCIDNKCISSGLIQRVLNWLRRMFGRK